ncbi:hypothetical protein FG386_002510 [Cryptosporidium ryanae]|uniref:uncharacterized protein n=1 Tax=Cryptosporidium ryanae TaxID=515981 RepID=UPI00351A720D|nr:hypothetical protein FG386_002510 [Cryptosporidium ryanae]
MYSEEKNFDNNSRGDALIPYSKVSKVVKYSTDKKFTKASMNKIQTSISSFIEELVEISEKQSRVRCGKVEGSNQITIKREDVIAAIRKGGNKFAFIHSSAEFTDENFWENK